MASEHHERGVVFLAEEFEAGSIFERVNGIFLGETYGVRAFEGVKIGEQGVDQGGGRRAAEEEGGFSIFDWERLLFCEGALRAGILGFSGSILLVRTVETES